MCMYLNYITSAKYNLLLETHPFIQLTIGQLFLIPRNEGHVFISHRWPIATRDKLTIHHYNLLRRKLDEIEHEPSGTSR